jgi:hypothetical protein
MAVGTALAIGSLIANVAGTALKARAEKKAAKEQQRVAEANAGVAEEQAVDATRRGEQDVSAFRRQVRGFIGTQRSAYAGQNVDVHTGTAADVRRDTERLAASDMDRIRRNAEREAQGFRSEAENYRRGGQYAASQGRWNVASTILGGATEASLLARRYGWFGKGAA